ncbi:MAG: hypothetical protein ACRDJY_03550, partial [Thermoleophilaceae bacterium]
FPSGPGVTTPTGSAVNCSSAPTLCGAAISGAGSDADPDRVVVQIGNGLSSAPSGFSVTAVSG